MTVASLHAPTLRSYLVSANHFPEKLYSLVDSYARAAIFNIFADGIINGHLVVDDDHGSHSFGNPDTSLPTVTLTVRKDRMWTRIMSSSDIGFSEAYLNGDFDVSSMKHLLDLWLDNRATLTGLSSTFSALCSRYSAIAIGALGIRQTLHMSRRNVEVAYDTSNSFFKCFLSDEMMYSCAIWSDAEGGPRGDLVGGPRPGDLEAAQLRKIHALLAKARVRPGDRLLEFGSGWGAMAIQAALLGCTVDTVTLSREQKAETEERARKAGVAERVRVHLCDYRQLPPEFAGAFDAFVSSEMIEAVGSRYLGQFFRILDWALKPDRATIVITATSQPEHRWSEYQPDDFGRHYHWPNSQLPSATSLPVAVQSAVPGKFIFHNLEDHGVHYPRTLREWGRRLEANFSGAVVAELQSRHPQLCDPAALAAFKRKWTYMFVYAEVGFARAYTSLFCWTFARPENIIEPCD
ncbi:cyclopropane fatty acid synthase [Epithele typhae]|uniref:cyclopropane fatty acid synthase n=1 Tax=Epithele typhae TaxID=378194 RepID=UPI0020077253|nr:cyclopropane fatty acid synthase [Epithele typhae]KAH9918572.1 cyclopropane fatty acid synthase [Epithele typhae]